MKRSSTVKSQNIKEPLAEAGLREQVTFRILTSVFEGQFRSGEHLTVGRLSRLFSVSATPVRQSLVELSGFGVVDLLPNRGAVVRPFDRIQLRDMMHVGRILKVEAARCAAGKLDSNELAAVRAEILELNGLPIDAECNFRVQLADDYLHTLIARHCGNPRLAVEVLRYLFLFKALRNISQVCDSWTICRHAEDIQELLQIVRCLAIGDPKRAAKAVDRHVRSVTKTISEIVFSPNMRSESNSLTSGTTVAPAIIVRRRSAMTSRYILRAAHFDR